MLEETVDSIVRCIRSGGKTIVFGVGGNAANAIHFSAELAGKFEEYNKPLPCIDLVSNISVLTAITNDFGWEHVFERQIEALAKPGDVVIGLSISTNGLYLVNAFNKAMDLHCSTILVCGQVTTGRTDLDWEDLEIVWELDSLDTPSVQEEQLRIIHQICGRVKEELS